MIPLSNLSSNYTLPETNSSHLKMDGWNTFSFPFGEFSAYFQGRAFAVSFRECISFPLVTESYRLLEMDAIGDFWKACRFAR